MTSPQVGTGLPFRATDLTGIDYLSLFGRPLSQLIFTIGQPCRREPSKGDSFAVAPFERAVYGSYGA
jgi:hypothetical protein